MKTIQSITTNIDRPGLRQFIITATNTVFDIRFVIDSSGVPGYLVFEDRKNRRVTIPIPADRVTAVVYADGSRTVSKIGKR